MQREMPFLAPCKPPQNAPDALVRRIDSDAQAVAVSLSASRLKGAYVAAALGRSPAWLSRVKGGELVMSEAQVERFCAVTGSNLVAQVRALREALAEIRGQLDAAETIRRLAAELRKAA